LAGRTIFRLISTRQRAGADVRAVSVRALSFVELRLEVGKCSDPVSKQVGRVSSQLGDLADQVAGPR